MQGSVGSIFDGGHVPLLQPAWQQLCTLVLESLPFMLFSLAVTLIAIFESDFRLAATPASADSFFTVLASLVLVEFAVELVRCWSKCNLECRQVWRAPESLSMVGCNLMLSWWKQEANK